ncbi:hypothetical protein V8B55DRAFT_1431939 [Mucor lusitanicus]
MFRQRIREKILSVIRNAPESNISEPSSTVTADTVGGNNKKRKQSFEVKQQKKAAKRRANDSDVVPNCKSCHQPGHKSSRSPLCRNHNPSKAEVLYDNLGGGYTCFTRKVSFEDIVKPEHRPLLKQRVTEACAFMEQLKLHMCLFVNYYCINRRDAPPSAVFKQNFWYSVSQMIMGKRITTSAQIPNDLLPAWDAFRRIHPNALLRRGMPTGMVSCISEECVIIATCFTNAIVEEFEKRVKSFLYFILQNRFVLIQPKDIHAVVDKFAYPYVGRGFAEWPSKPFVNDDFKATVKRMCTPLQSLVVSPATLENMSANPQDYFLCLKQVSVAIEEQHSNHAMDVRRVPPPRAFALLPTPTIRWPTVSLSCDAISSFMRKPRRRGYNQQLQLYYDIFDFSKLGFESIQELQGNGNNQVMFANLVTSDGTSANMVFHRRKPSQEDTLIRNHKLQMKDFTLDEVLTHYQPFFVDPGRKSLYTAVSPDFNYWERAALPSFTDFGSLQVRKMSTKEYRFFMDGGLHKKWLKRIRDANLELLLSQTPTPKTASSDAFNNYCAHQLNNFNRISEIHNAQSGKRLLGGYKGRQRAKQFAVNFMANGGKKYNRERRGKTRSDRRSRQRLQQASQTVKKRKFKFSRFFYDPARIPLVIFGSATLGKDHVPIRGLPSGSTNVLYQQLKERELNGDLLVVLADEYLTSQVCSTCNQRDLIKMPGVTGFSVLKCRNCHKKWQRDFGVALAFPGLPEKTSN